MGGRLKGDVRMRRMVGDLELNLGVAILADVVLGIRIRIYSRNRRLCV